MLAQSIHWSREREREKKRVGERRKEDEAVYFLQILKTVSSSFLLKMLLGQDARQPAVICPTLTMTILAITLQDLGSFNNENKVVCFVPLV